MSFFQRLLYIFMPFSWRDSHFRCQGCIIQKIGTSKPVEERFKERLEELGVKPNPEVKKNDPIAAKMSHPANEWNRAVGYRPLWLDDKEVWWREHHRIWCASWRDYGTLSCDHHSCCDENRKEDWQGATCGFIPFQSCQSTLSFLSETSFDRLWYKQVAFPIHHVPCTTQCRAQMALRQSHHDWWLWRNSSMLQQYCLWLSVSRHSRSISVHHFVSAQPNRLFRNPILPQGFKHLVDAAFLLLHIGMNIEIQGRGDIGVS